MKEKRIDSSLTHFMPLFIFFFLFLSSLFLFERKRGERTREKRREKKGKERGEKRE